MSYYILEKKKSVVRPVSTFLELLVYRWGGEVLGAAFEWLLAVLKECYLKIALYCGIDKLQHFFTRMMKEFFPGLYLFN